MGKKTLRSVGALLILLAVVFGGLGFFLMPWGPSGPTKAESDRYFLIALIALILAIISYGLAWRSRTAK